ncbi:SMI1/KNR4 family protein [Nocardia sp. NPDC058666]|uniref:SMI1/KNR4 family protein n=1 Tax=Nocardia sp. NPDC058666 TaxID=3346587 RepID=UPI0036548C59
MIQISVGYRVVGEPALLTEVDRLAKHLDTVLPGEYRTYLLESDGGWLEDNDQAIDEIFGVGANIGEGISIWDQLEVYDGRVPKWLLPIARDSYGNLIALSLRLGDLGTVWFWDHEEEGDDEALPPTCENISMISSSWTEFLDGLVSRELT